MDHEATPEADGAGGRDSAVIAAMLRIGASLDLDTVPCEAVAGARGLNGARYGASSTSTVPESPLEFVTSQTVHPLPHHPFPG